MEFDLVVAEDGKKKAFRVTGPDGAPPQVRLPHAARHGWSVSRRIGGERVAKLALCAM